MKAFLILALLLLTGCGNLRITPRSCKSDGVYGSSTDTYDFRVKKIYYNFFEDEEVRLVDLIDCQKVELLKVEIQKNMLFKYIVTLEFKEKK